MHLADQLQGRQRQNGKLELHFAGALQHIDSGTAVNFENLRNWGHTVLYMRLCFQVDATAKTAIQLGLEIAHFLTQLA